MKEEVRSKTKKKMSAETEESPIEQGRRESCESFRGLVPLAGAGLNCADFGITCIYCILGSKTKCALCFRRFSIAHYA